jgi:predicted O-methyltransferase YrrM
MRFKRAIEIIRTFNILRSEQGLKSALQRISDYLTATARPHKKIDTSLWKSAPLQLHRTVTDSALVTNDPLEIKEYLEESRSNDKNALLKGEIFPQAYDTNEETLQLLKLLVESRRPKVIIETGVANGASTRALLNEIERLGIECQLHSFDIDPRVATSELIARKNWHFHLIQDHTGLSRDMNAIGDVDIFYHDSDHSYENQFSEYMIAWKHLKPNGILISDDINWSNAFFDFCTNIGRSPLVLSGLTKYAGLVVK